MLRVKAQGKQRSFAKGEFVCSGERGDDEISFQL